MKKLASIVAKEFIPQFDLGMETLLSQTGRMPFGS